MFRVTPKMKPATSSRSELKRLAGVSTMALMLAMGGCASFQKDHFKVGSVPEDYRTKHPIVVSQDEVKEDDDADDKSQARSDGEEEADKEGGDEEGVAVRLNDGIASNDDKDGHDSFFFADDEHVGNFVELGEADLGADFLAGGVRLDTDASLKKFHVNFSGVVEVLFRNR